ncbi:transcriptional regulator [Vallitalea longa]|uniref:Transcriptional regulator n=1 Tax=Vallitalea longa TaxID=2936439 RepID=A0A9W5Y7Z9_9FIRM|nr:XRE family transcriptional regulator [Vallitalea longa]GKX28777.1 transcriptional regulator [Vallitalea longa]
MESLGSKIKRIRKELHITQSQLADKDMTKSMISQIENNIATPSMKNLKIIADRLNKPVSFFLDQSNRNVLPLNIINDELKSIDILINKLEYKKAIEKLNLLLKTYNFSQYGKLNGDILFKLSECLGALNLFHESQENIDKAIKIYENNQLFSDAAMAQMEKINRYVKEYDYKTCLDILDVAMDKYNQSIIKNYFFELNYLYLKAMINSSLGNFENAIILLNDAIRLSKEKHIYYNSDMIYQTLACINLINNNNKLFLYNIKKAKQFSVFTEDNFRLSLININYAQYENINDKPTKALEYLTEVKSERKDLLIFYMIEKAKANYLLKNYKMSLDLFNKINYKDTNTWYLHKHDYLFMWSAKIYHGLALMKIGNLDDALIEMKIGISKLEVFENSIYHIFAYKSISELYNLMHNYKAAFKYLKLANTMESFLKELPFK